MSTYTDFLPEVLPYVRDCPEPVAENAVRNACIDFCDRAMWLLYNHPDIVVAPGQSTYSLDLPAGTTISRIMDAWLDKKPLAPIAEDALKNMFAGDWRETQGQPCFYTHIDPNQVILAPVPVRPSGTLKLLVGLRPTRSSTTVDDSLLERWVEYIGYGARARLHTIPGQPYFDMGLAANARVMFEHGVNLAKIERNRGHTRYAATVQMPRFI